MKKLNIHLDSLELESKLKKGGFNVLDQSNTVIEMKLSEIVDWINSHDIKPDKSANEECRQCLNPYEKGVHTCKTTDSKEEFVECDNCRSKPGSPILCDSCLNNREIISRLVKHKPTPTPSRSEVEIEKLEKEYPPRGTQMSYDQGFTTLSRLSRENRDKINEVIDYLKAL